MDSVRQSSDQNRVNDVVPDSCGALKSLDELRSIPKPEPDHEVQIQQTSPSESTWVSPLCVFCKAIFDEWAKFLLDTKYQVPHYGLWSEVKASAENGCSLCTQFVRAAEIELLRNGEVVRRAVPTKDDGEDSISPDYIKAQGSESVAQNGSSKVPPDPTLGGYVTMSNPGEGYGRIEKAYRLHLRTLNMPLFSFHLENRAARELKGLFSQSRG
jgi:hypothetical protein